MRLDRAEIARYRREGWLNVGEILAPGSLAALRREERRVRPLRPYGRNEIVFRAQLAAHSSLIRRFITSGPCVDLARQLIGPNIIVWYNQYVTKLPGDGDRKNEFPWHQDNGYIPVEPATNIIFWIALDDSDEKNGCLRVVPKSHRSGLLKHETESVGWYRRVASPVHHVSCVLKARQALVMTGLTVHASGRNQSTKPRRALLVRYAEAGATYRRPGELTAKPLTTFPEAWVVAGQAPWREKQEVYFDESRPL